MSPGTFHVTEQCRPATEMFQLIGDKWTIPVVMLLSGGSRRFSELRREMPGISQRMLTLSLRSLERNGLINRTVTPTVPQRVDYELTALGHSFSERAALLGEWAFKNKTAVDAAREAFDSRIEPSVEKISPAQNLPARAARAAERPAASPAGYSDRAAVPVKAERR